MFKKLLIILLALSFNIYIMNAIKNTKRTIHRNNKKLINAILSNNIKKVKELINKDAMVNATDKYGDWSPFLYAITRGNINIIKLLIDSFGANVNIKERDGATALHWDVHRGDKETVELLICRGANVNAKNNMSFTCLHYASMDGHKEIVELLLNSGADKTIKIKKGRHYNKTAADKADSQEIKEMINSHMTVAKR